MNHLAHSESTKVAKGLEASLRERLEDGELIRQKLEGEIRKCVFVIFRLVDVF